jgi:hypothetical protein
MPRISLAHLSTDSRNVKFFLLEHYSLVLSTLPFTRLSRLRVVDSLSDTSSRSLYVLRAYCGGTGAGTLIQPFRLELPCRLFAMVRSDRRRKMSIRCNGSQNALADY